MSTKLFSMIHDDERKVYLNKKIIPASDFDLVLNAEEVLYHVNNDAENYRLEITKECEQLKAQAQQEGFAAGYLEWTKYIRQLEDEIANVRVELGKKIIPVALKAARKIVGREIELSEETVVDIVSNSLKSVAQHKKVTIYVNKRDFDILEKYRPKLKLLFENLESLSIRERNDIERGGCVIETEGGIINAQLDNLWDALERAFSVMMKQPKLETSLKEIKSQQT